MDNAAQTFTLDDLNAAAPRVLARLRSMADLPRYGTVAGQAVASLFWEELGLPMRGPVNDIDVFVNRGLPRNMRGLAPLPEDFDPYKQPARKTRTSSRKTEVTAEYSPYEHVKFLAMRYTTKILRTYASGLVNFTLIENLRTPHGQLGHADDVSHEIVEGFDLNMVSVGINLETGNASASPAFLGFLSTGQIKVQTCNTPSHTMMRLASKCRSGQIQGTTCNLDQEFALLIAAIRCQREFDPRENYSINLFGHKYRKLHEKFQDILPPLEHCPEMDDPRKIPGSCNPPQTVNLYRLAPDGPRSPQEEKLIKAAKTLMCFSGAHMPMVTHFPSLYEAFHPERGGLDPRVADIRRQAFDQLLALAPQLSVPEKDGSDSEVDAYRHTCDTLGLSVHTSPMEGMDDKDVFAFFFGQQAGKSQAQADAAAQAFMALSVPLQHTLFALGEGADTALQFKNNPNQACIDLIGRHESEAFNTWGYCGASRERVFASEQRRILAAFMDSIEAMGHRGEELIRKITRDDVGFKQLERYRFFKNLPDLVGPDGAMKLMEWISPKSIPGWPSISDMKQFATANSMPEEELHSRIANLVGAWISSDCTPPSRVFEGISGKAAASMLKSVMDCARIKPGDERVVILEDGRSLISMIEQSLTLQDVFDPSNGLVEYAFGHGFLTRLVDVARNHPQSQIDLEDIKKARDLIENKKPAHWSGDIPFGDELMGNAPCKYAAAIAFLDRLVLDAQVSQCVSSPTPRTGPRF